MSIPKVFISYSHDSQNHKKWVLELATRLRNNGIDAILDQFELKPGDDLPHFMEVNLESADKILMICTETYVSKANSGQGGVGYEKMIITSNLLSRIDENKIIPIIRQTASGEVPTFLKTKLYINFSKDEDYEFSYDNLVRTIHDSPLFKKPPVGNNPFKPVAKEKLEDDTKLLDEILKRVLEHQGVGKYSYTPTMLNKLSISPILFRISITKLVKLGFLKHYYHNDFNYISSTDKGLNYAFENKLVK